MPIVPFAELMAHAAEHRCAIGYFESWNLESLLAVADAACAARSPVILGFSGIYLAHPARAVRDPLAAYLEMARAVAATLPVPVVLLLNESPWLEIVDAAVADGFGMVMWAPDDLPPGRRAAAIAELVRRARARGVAVEAEMAALTGVGGTLSEAQSRPPLTDPAAAEGFVRQTAIDALAVDVGQVHLHGRAMVRLDLDRLERLTTLGVPLVLHGGSSIDEADLRAAVALGVRKVNVGSVLKQAYLKALIEACAVADVTNPYEAIGSGLASDVLVPGRLAVQAEVERWLRLLGSAGTAR